MNHLAQINLMNPTSLSKISSIDGISSVHVCLILACVSLGKSYWYQSIVIFSSVGTIDILKMVAFSYNFQFSFCLQF